MDEYLPVSLPVRSADLTGRRVRSFDLRPDAAARVAIAAAVGIEAVEALLFTGDLRPSGKSDVMLEARLEARVVQACVITLAPVTALIDTPVRRHYLAGLEMPGDPEAEMPEDDSVEPLPEIIDVGAVLLEALALALPDYPRAEGAGLGEAVFTAPGAAPLKDEDLKPFAGLAALKARLEDK